jgi:hypothetical protein
LRAEALQRAGTNQACLAVGSDASHIIFCLDQVGYFLSPLDFLKHLLTFFLFRAAFKRLALLRFFMLASVFRSLNSH